MIINDKDKQNEAIGLNGIMVNSIELRIDRPVYMQDKLNETTFYEKPEKNIRSSIKTKVTGFSFPKTIRSLIPVIKWLPKYKWKRDILSDVFAGSTIAILHIPQGIAYAILGNIHPVVGLYMAFFPVLIYFFLGTSRHVSMGTFAIVCLMTGRVVSDYGNQQFSIDGTMQTIESLDPDVKLYNNLDVAITVTFTVALIQFVMYVFRLGIIANILSDTLVNGFTCAAAFQVVASQLKDLFGLPIKKRRGMFSLPLTVYDSFLALPQGNRAAISISFVCVVLMVINNEIIKNWLAKRTKIPIPIELIAVVLGTGFSYFLDFPKVYGVRVIGDIPTGLPAIKVPVFELIPTIFIDSLIIAIVSYSITISLAFIFAHKSHYDVNSNQELFAMGASNLFGSFFSCMPITASLSRSHIQHAVGGMTQIASVVSAGLLLFVLLFLGPCFETLPRCVLASVIVVALKGMLQQCTQFPKFYRLSKWDAFVWLSTFLPTALVSIDLGLLIGVVVSLISLFCRGYKPYTCLLGNLPNTDLYLDTGRYKGVEEVTGLKIFHYCGALNFSSKALFKRRLFRTVCMKPSKRLATLARGSTTGSLVQTQDLLLKCLVIDFSALSYIDVGCVHMFGGLIDEYREVEVEVYIAGCSGPVYETFMKCAHLEPKKYNFLLFPTVHDAVLYGKRNLLLEK